VCLSGSGDMFSVSCGAERSFNIVGDVVGDIVVVRRIF